jgi:hypothetical protein
MRKAILVALLCVASTSTAWADQGVGIGLFVGEPLGLDLKLGLGFRSNLDIVIGWDTYRDGRDGYGHVTYLATLGVAHGRAISVPFRLGIGGAVYGDGGAFNDGVNFAVRAPFEIGIKFHNAPIELYGEVALKLTLIDDNNNNDDVDLDGGIGFRVYF